jgi:hypothetical protein
VSLAPNAGFEEGAGDRPAAWSFYSWKDSAGWWDNQFAHSGKKSLGLRGPDGGWSANLPVELGKTYSVKLHYRAEGGPSRVTLFVRGVKGPRDLENMVYKPVPTLPPDKKGRFVDGAFVGGADENGWVLFDGGEFVPSQGIDTVNLLLKLTSQQTDVKVWLDDVVVAAVAPRTVPDTARLLRDLPGGTVWTDSENAKLLPDRQPPAGNPLPALKIAAAQGEYESFQVAVTPRVAWGAVNWDWAPLSGPGALTATTLRCRRVETINIEKTMGPHGHRGLNPDPLTDRLPCDVLAGTNQSFWFTAAVPLGQAPGTYATELALSVGGKEVCRVPLKLRVRGFALPRRPSLDVRSAFRYNLALARESGNPEDVLKRYYRDFHAHRTRCSPGVLVRPKLVGDNVVVDLEEYVRHLKFMRDELGADRVDLPALWIGHTDHTLPADAQWLGRPIFANAELTALSPAFEQPFRAYLAQLVKRLKDEGLFRDPSVRFFDEPNLDHEPTVNALRTLSKLLLEVEPALTVANTATYPHPRLIDLCKLWVLHTDAWYPNLQHLETARRAGCRISVYNNAVNYPEHNPLRVRLWPWLLRKYQVDGTYSWWGTVCWRGEVENPWTCGVGSSGVLLYPPRSPEEHGPIDSVRWELFREGLEDYEYLRLADELAGKLEAAGDGVLAKQGRDAVAAALALVEKWPNVQAANDEPYTLDVTQVAEARERLAEAIEGMGAEAG